MMHPATSVVEINPRVGRGVRATAPIPRGTIVWARDAADEVLSPDEVEALPAKRRAFVHTYGYRDSRGFSIVCADAGKYVNHSCQPTLRGVGHDVMIAIRDIERGEEITCDYAECNLERDLECACGSPSCRGHIRLGDLLLYSGGWDVDVREAVRHAPKVAQPVLPFALDRDAVRSVIAGISAPLSLFDVAYRAGG